MHNNRSSNRPAGTYPCLLSPLSGPEQMDINFGFRVDSFSGVGQGDIHTRKIDRLTHRFLGFPFFVTAWDRHDGYHIGLPAFLETWRT